MTCRNIYDLALSLLGEDMSGRYSSDYAERAPYILSMLCSLLADKDRILRSEHGLDVQGELDAAQLELDGSFPLCIDFAVAAAYYLASMLVFDSDGIRADSLYEKYVDAVNGVMHSIPAVCVGIAQRYSY